jgi:predicted Zn-dependent peptidase
MTSIYQSDTLHIYQLANQMMVYLAKNTDAPKIQSFLAVRAGSNQDPTDNTGLAHYLEHMMFKGTSKLGTQNWAKEAPLLAEIEQLFEAHKAENDEAKKKLIYAEIDKISLQASQFSIANEYDKMLSHIGASGTNAHTWLNETVYKNTIPNTALEVFLQIESERFAEVQLRLFHTELETVYEEFNKSQDNEGRQLYQATLSGLFEAHPNGTQTTLGKAEHLKNPSVKAIKRFFAQYYVPNNMAMVLVGDLDFEESLALVNQYFGHFEPKTDLPKWPKSNTKLSAPKLVKLASPSSAKMRLAWAGEDYGHPDFRKAFLLVNLLSNSGNVGLLDLHINQHQKALAAYAYAMPLTQYSVFAIDIYAKPEQNFEDLKALLWPEINKLKNGEFEESTLQSIINDFKLKQISALENTDGMGTALYEAFIRNRSWEEEMAEIEAFKSISKADLVAFAQEFFTENALCIEKHDAPSPDLIRIEPPSISPIALNREQQSAFYQHIAQQKITDIQPVFLDYQSAMTQQKCHAVDFYAVANTTNALAQWHAIFPFGTDHEPLLKFALASLEYMGSDSQTLAEINTQFFALGYSFDFKIGADQTIISLNGLEENLCQAIALLHQWLQNLSTDEELLAMSLNQVLEIRDYYKKDKNKIFNALFQYAKYGENSRHLDLPSEATLRQYSAQAIRKMLQDLWQKPHQYFYYGSQQDTVFEFLKSIAPQAFDLPISEAKVYGEPATNGQIYVFDYDMVQADLMLVAKSQEMTTQNMGKIAVFNEYFGRGLSSVVFQELREAKSLAYSAYVSHSSATQLGKSHYVSAYIGTSPEKFVDAYQSLQQLLTKMPEIPLQFENAKQQALKQMAASRIGKSRIFFNYLSVLKLGKTTDIRQDIYQEIELLQLADLADFFVENIANGHYSAAVMGKEDLVKPLLEALGEYQTCSAEQIFGY